MPEVGDIAPDFVLPSTEGDISLRDLLAEGKKVVLAFYTEDDTPLCSQEISSLSHEFEILRELKTAVVGISVDSVETHYNFCEKLGGCPFPLASDEDLKVARLYQVMSSDNKRSNRAMFVVGEEGTIIHKNDWYQPSNPAQFLEVFSALGIE